jgi:hypothetical protein
MSDHEYDFEPVRGLPERLPAGETILWQGSPDWKALALQAYRVRAIAFYFGVLLAWKFVVGATDGQTIAAAVLGTTWLALLASAALAMLALLAWLSARTTVYTLTNRRVVIRHGIALPMTVNIPFTVIESAAVKARPDGIGEIALLLTTDQRLAYLLTWPHVRPWHITRTQPAMRALPAASHVAQLLASALQGSAVVTQQDAALPVAA